MLGLQARLSAETGAPRAAAIPCAPEEVGKTAAKDNASRGRSRRTARTPLLSSLISLMMAIACGLAAINICCDKPVLGIMGAPLSVLAAQLVKIPPTKPSAH